MGNEQSKAPPPYKWVHIPRTAKRPCAPGRPDVVPPPTDEYLQQQQQPDVVTVRWKPPEIDGGTPITGYLVERRDMGTTVWVRAHAALTREPEIALAGLEPGRRYQFRVSAENALGLSPPSEPSAPLAVSTGSVATVPHFLRELKDAIAIEHEKVTFSVHVLGTPTPHISWYKDAFEVFSSKRIRVSTEHEKSSITFYQVGLSDEGDIKCTATNRAGHVVTKARLRVEAPPRVKVPKTYEDGLLFELDDVIRLKATFTGRPAPTITWLHNGEELQNDNRCEIVTTERSTSIRLLDSNREDRGEYHVRAINDLGEDTAAVLVTVTDRPCPPSKPQILSMSGRAVTLSWESPDDDGGCKIGNYTVEYYRIGWNVWLKAATCRLTSATLDDLIEGSEYRFRVKAENPYGMSEPGPESDDVFIPDPKRGLFQPPSKSSNSDVIAASDEWLEERRKRRAAMLEELEPKPPPAKQGAAEVHAVAAKDLEPEDDVMEEDDEDELLEDEEEYSDEEEEEEEPSRAGSELMLVLVPDADKVRGTTQVQRQDTNEGGEARLSRQPSLADAPPPMSLSAPELSALGSMMEKAQQTPLQFQRNAVSSTELLHERAMARLYQALAAEEAAAEKKRQEGLAEEDALESLNLPSRGTITDTGQKRSDIGQQAILPLPEKPILKPALKKPKRKIPPEPKLEDDFDDEIFLLDTKKSKNNSDYFAEEDDDIDYLNKLDYLSSSISKRPLSPPSRPFTPDESDSDITRAMSPYLRGPILHKYPDDDLMETSSSRPTSAWSTRSASPFSKVLVMDEPPEGYDYGEPSPPPTPPPPKPKKIKIKKEKIVHENTSPEVFKVPTLEITTPEESLTPKIKFFSDDPIITPKIITTENKPKKKKLKEKVIEELPTTDEIVPVKKKKIKTKSIDSEISISPEPLPELPEPVKKKKIKSKIIDSIIPDIRFSPEPPTELPEPIKKKKIKAKTTEPDRITPELRFSPEPPPMTPEPILKEPPKEPKMPKKGVLKKPKKDKVEVVKEIEKPPSPEIKTLGGLKTKLKKVKEKFPGEKKKKEPKVTLVTPIPEEIQTPEIGTPEISSGKKQKDKKLKEKKSKKDKSEKAEGEDSEKLKEKKGFSILGVKLRRPAEMTRELDGEENPEAPSRRKKSQSRPTPVRLPSQSSIERAEEEAAARQVVVDRYGELINDLSSKRQFMSRRHIYLEREELKAAAPDEDPLEHELSSPSPPLSSSAPSSAAPTPAPEDLEAQSEEESSAAQIQDYDDVAEDEDDWEEEESSHISELPPSPPRSATPKRRPRSSTPKSQHVTPEEAGESARAAVTKMTNFAVLLVVLWLSVTVDWHLGLGVAVLYAVRKVYLIIKAKIQQLTGWGGLKRKEKSPSPPPPPVTPLPPPSPQQDEYSQEDSYEDDETEGYTENDLDDIEEEDEDDLELDYSEQHSNNPYKYK